MITALPYMRHVNTFLLAPPEQFNFEDDSAEGAPPPPPPPPAVKPAVAKPVPSPAVTVTVNDARVLANQPKTPFELRNATVPISP